MLSGRCLLDTYRSEVYPSYTLIEQDVGNRCFELRYTWVQSWHFHLHFSNLSQHETKDFAATITGRQDAGGSWAELSFQMEECLEASFLLTAFWWPWERGSIVIQDIPWILLYCTWRTTWKPAAWPWHPMSFWQTCLVRMFVTICRQCETGKDHVSAHLQEGCSPERELSAWYSGMEVSM